MARRTNQLLIGDTLWDIDKTYRDGAKAARKGERFDSHSHLKPDQQDQFEAGHTHEHAHFHLFHGIDVITQPAKGHIFTVPESLIALDA